MNELQTSLFKFLDPDDIPRLKRHLERFIEIVSDGQWWTLNDVARAVGCAQTSASARWRDLKKLGYSYEKKRHATIQGLWLYRLVK